jgi:hypothetical protein
MLYRLVLVLVFMLIGRRRAHRVQPGEQGNAHAKADLLAFPYAHRLHFPSFFQVATKHLVIRE